MGGSTNSEPSHRRRLLIALAVLLSVGGFLAYPIVEGASGLLQLAIVLVGMSIFGGFVVHEGRRAFDKGADLGEAAVHGLAQALRAYVGMRPKDPPKY